MRVISRSAIREFCQRFSKAETSLDVWYRNVVDADWNSLVDVRQMYPQADAVGRCTVFNIHGNRYRLIARINYQHRTLYIRGIYSHAEYDEGGWKDGCEVV
ncbi:MAG: type II toxin-antitoxin system HigB family toxin [Acidobacteriia bacterium]|nr:type II toxin-antitoxin system HigB family toxin [Terriglobia bacterium]